MMTALQRSGRWKRIVILGILVAFAGVLFASRDVLSYHLSPATHYRKHHDSDSLWAVLKYDIRNGDPVPKVENLLGPAKRNNDSGYRALCKRNAAANPKQNPDGFEDADELLGYSTGNLWIHLQARNGHLVNFDPADYPISFNVLF